MQAQPDNRWGNRWRLLSLLYIVCIMVSSLTRVVLTVMSWSVLEPGMFVLLKIFSVGLVFDLVTMTYFAIPVVVYLTVVPNMVFMHRFHRLIVYAMSLASIYFVLFISVAEVVFFDEFGVRFNFIAVDYLIYTTELVNNIRESYPIYAILSAVGLVTLSLFMSIRRRITDVLISSHEGVAVRIKFALLFLLLPLLSGLFFSKGRFDNISDNAYVKEIASNGIYDFFVALGANDLDYKRFYLTLSDDSVSRGLRALVREDNSVFVSDDKAYSIDRVIKGIGGDKDRLNVVVVVVESLSAEYMGVFGNKSALTPNLDRLSTEGLFFTNFLATGTRTVRGLEAVTLSLPPTPGGSIIKQQHNEELPMSWGWIMKQKGYQTAFIYGGDGFFDNMNYFFGHNGFDTIIDRKNFAKDEVVFENAWGVCDEALFSKAISEFDKSYVSKKPFFTLIMTTSNHRPYTYPDGRVDIASATGRDGAVKYTDYAIGKFIKDSSQRPWFKDTIFVVLADHCANSAGKTQLPVEKYRIPLFVYSPGRLNPMRIGKLASQIDVAPTVLALMGQGYRSGFFGKDILKLSPVDERAFIGTYESLGYIKNNKQVILQPNGKVSVFELDHDRQVRTTSDEQLLNEAITYYQGAHEIIKSLQKRGIKKRHLVI
ncbi:phosphoglycerol transferase family protein, alkaline phosphatase superfamily [Candidatus Magnetobacterium bavaricum]|uniref:Phosphoglycerol transferase family protein, alkaline phosphatase superfamily n=1 Tax=Candidatus Magnetobacterium bavaricum TaxID=29290 RepID=A0A0F3GRK4_9BACT|nr:phosphoglycerol transferase family protein, alkaline phosphatase superfamily [Candidatus Magnetobacterium bavaricum]